MGVSRIFLLVQLSLNCCTGLLVGDGEFTCFLAVLLWGSSWNGFQETILEVGDEYKSFLSVENEGWQMLLTC